jgi:hypothetical protein
MKTEFTVDVPTIGKVDVCRQDEGMTDPFWDLFDSETDECLNEGTPFWTKPTVEEVFDFFRCL